MPAALKNSVNTIYTPGQVIFHQAILPFITNKKALSSLKKLQIIDYQLIKLKHNIVHRVLL
jgi:hypothetical protein